MERAEDFLWRGDGEEAEVVVFAPDAETARRTFGRALGASDLPGVPDAVYAAASGRFYGQAVASTSHTAPALVSGPRAGLLVSSGLSGETFARSLGVPLEGLGEEIRRRLGEGSGRLPRLSGARVRRVCEAGALAAAEEGLLEEEDLAFFAHRPGDPDSLGRRAVSAGERDWEKVLEEVAAYEAGEVLDSEGAESLGISEGEVVFEVGAGAGELGRLALGVHEARISERVERGTFDPTGTLRSAPLDTEEARDSLAASAAAANFAAARAALALYALRRTFRDAGPLDLRAAWKVGGAQEEDAGNTVHRFGLAGVGEGEGFVLREGSFGAVAAGRGRMEKSAPPFGGREGLWEEAGLLEGWTRLRSLEG